MSTEEETFEALKYRIVIDDMGTKRYYNQQGQFHRENGPAIEYSDGDKFWYFNGNRHRTDGPASEHRDGSKFWYINGNRHCTDGPAIECSDGRKFWYINGERLSEKEFNEFLQRKNNA